MRTGGRRFGIALGTAMLSFAAAAAAQEPGPPVEPEATPYDDEGPPPDGAQPPGGPPPAQAAPPPGGAPAPVPTDDSGFGFAGQLTVSDDLQLLAAQSSTDFQGATTKFIQVQIQPAFDYFPAPNLSVGGRLIIGYVKFEGGGSSSDQIELGLMARVGYSFAFSPTSAVWPRVGLGYDHLSGSGQSTTQFPFEVYVPFVFLPTSHFFVGIGPIIRTDLAQSNDSTPKTTTVGVQSTIGGCFRAM